MAIAENTGQRVTNFVNGGTSLDFTFSTAPLSNEFIVICMSWRDNATVTGNDGLNEVTGGNADGIDSAIFYGFGDGVKTTYTITLSASVRIAGCATTYSGVQSSSPLDTSNSNFGTGTAGTTGSTGTLSANNNLIIALFSNLDNATWASHDNGMSEILEISTGGTPAIRNTTSMATKIATVSTAINPGATLSSSLTWSAVVATFLAEVVEEGGPEAIKERRVFIV